MNDFTSQLRAKAEKMRERNDGDLLARRIRLQNDNSNIKPLTQQIEELMLSLPPAQRNRAWTMSELVSRLHGKYQQRPSAGDVGIALRSLGWLRKRDWSAEGGGRRYWMNLLY